MKNNEKETLDFVDNLVINKFTRSEIVNYEIHGSKPTQSVFGLENFILLSSKQVTFSITNY